MKDKKMLYGIGIVFLFLASVGFSYAYFTASIANKDVKDQVVTTGTLELTYTDGPEIKMLNIKPGQTITKKVTVKNTGTLDTTYNFVWQELNNTITNDEMVISATCKRLNGEVEEEACEGVDETPIKENIIKNNISIEPGITHEYNVTITFKETNTAQNYNQGKTFSGVLGINEYKKGVSEPVYCTYDGELVQGAEYVNGQYTYRYMQEGGDSSYGLVWNNITSDGWGVQLTNKESTDAVTSKVCTYINNKPIVSMSSIFENSQATTIDLSGFDTSNVTNMAYMFFYSHATTLDVSKFDTSKVTNMSYMFTGAQATTLDVSNFNTSKVTNMSAMFSSTQATVLYLNNFNTSNVTNMDSMFSGSQATILDLSSFDTSKVTNMNVMFAWSQATTLDLSNFDTSNVTDMSNMFDYSQATTLDLSNFNTSKVTNMRYMFSDSQVTALDLSNFNTSNVTDMSDMFDNTQITKLDLKSFDTSNVTNMYRMFSGSQATSLDLSNFNTSKVTNMGYMFYGSQATTINLSSFDTSKVTNMEYMFYKSGSLKSIYTSSKFNTSNVTNSSQMFSGCTSLVGGAGTVYDSTKTDKTYARIDGGTSSPGYFTLKSN